MDSFEFNKIAGAVLAALLLIFGTATLLDIAGGGHGPGHGDHDKVGYKLEVDRTASAAKPGKKAPAFDPASVVKLIAKADPKVGAGVFGRCKACHLVDKSGRSLPTGPNLWGIVGRKIAAGATYKRYSPAFKKQSGEWTYERLVQYLRDPRGFIPGNRMSFAGIRDATELAGLIAYLRTLSDKPVPLP